MTQNESDLATSTADTVPTSKIRILRAGEVPSDTDPLAVADDESVGFDPYDTASLYVQKSADSS